MSHSNHVPDKIQESRLRAFFETITLERLLDLGKDVAHDADRMKEQMGLFPDMEEKYISKCQILHVLRKVYAERKAKGV